VRVEQRDDQVVTHRDYDILRDKIDELIDDVDGLLKIKDNETMVPLYIANEIMRYVNKNITELNRSNVPPLYEPSFYPAIDLYQLLKFKRLKKIDFDIFTHSRIILPGVNDDGMPNIIEVPRKSSGEEVRSRVILYKFFKKNFNSKIKYIYRSSTRRDSPPIEYDLEGLKSILVQELSLRAEREPNGESSSGEEVEVKVFPWKYKGKNYLKSSDNRVYDIKTQERIGKWNMNTNQIEPLSESSDDSE
jgi:hypothetical protein